MAIKRVLTPHKVGIIDPTHYKTEGMFSPSSVQTAFKSFHGGGVNFARKRQSEAIAHSNSTRSKTINDHVYTARTSGLTNRDKITKGKKFF